VQLRSNPNFSSIILKRVVLATKPYATNRKSVHHISNRKLQFCGDRDPWLDESDHVIAYSSGIISKSIGPIEILHITKFAQNLISYKKYSNYFHVGPTEISIFLLELFLRFVHPLKGVAGRISLRKS
jgi:hypothetical protein